MRKGQENLTRPVKSLDPKEVAKALYLAGGSKSEAAKAVGVSRPSLYNFLKLYPAIEPGVKAALEQPMEGVGRDPLSTDRVWRFIESIDAGLPRTYRG